MTTPAPMTKAQLFLTFLKLGCMAFGGPAAHLVLFYQYFVQQKAWLSEHEYAHLLALAQILPGPTSSQVGIAIGYHLHGYRGALFAWLGFTLPSALLMCLAAFLGLRFSNTLNHQFFHVVQLIVLAVVAWAFWQMMRSFCKTPIQYVLMILSAIFVYVVNISINQILVIICAAFIGFIFYYFKNFQAALKPEPAQQNQKRIEPISSHPIKWSWLWLIGFFVPFIVLPLFSESGHNLLWHSLESFYRTASFVFGGGHIILPFLHQDFVSTGQISNQNFDLGYAIAQLMPGPLFSFATYLGTLLPMTSSALVNAILATIAIFLPSFFLLFGLLPYWRRLMQYQIIFSMLQTVNAAVVGLLLCLLIQMCQKYVLQWLDFVFMICVIALLRTKLPVWLSLIGSFGVYYAVLICIS